MKLEKNDTGQGFGLQEEKREQYIITIIKSILSKDVIKAYVEDYHGVQFV